MDIEDESQLYSTEEPYEGCFNTYYISLQDDFIVAHNITPQLYDLH